MTREEQNSIRHEIDLIIRMLNCICISTLNATEHETKERVIVRLQILKARIA